MCGYYFARPFWVSLLRRAGCFLAINKKEKILQTEKASYPDFVGCIDSKIIQEHIPTLFQSEFMFI